MKWTAGKDSHGKVPLLEDGMPVFAVSDCGKYTVSRAHTLRGYVHDAWLRQSNDRGGWSMPVQLVGGVSSSAAILSCVVHQRGD